MFGALLSAAAIVCATVAVSEDRLATETVRGAFRVFDGTLEVTAETRLRVRRSGDEDDEGRLLEGPPLAADLPAGIYDVQAIRHRSGRVLGVRWAERLVIVQYPDEEGEHLEVINFASGYGALQLRLPPDVPPDPAIVTLQSPEQQPAAESRVVTGPGYLLVIAPAGVYDVVLSLPAGRETLAAVEIPADRTRMRLAGGNDR